MGRRGLKRSGAEDIASIYLGGELLGRKGIFHSLYNLATAGGKKVFLHGPPKTGKTEVLTGLYRSLFHHQDRIVPFYYAFPEGGGVYELCKDYLTEFIKHYIAFIRDDPSLIKAGSSLRRLQGILGDYSLPSSPVDDLYEQIGDENPLGAVRVAFSAPSLFSSVENARFCLLLDDLHNLGSKGEVVFKELARILVEEGLACILAGYLTPEVKAFIGDMAGRFRMMRLDAIPEEEVRDSIQTLSGLYRVRLKEEEMLHVLERLGYHPFYIRLVLDAIDERKGGLCDIKDFYTVYFDELSEGRLYHHLSTILDPIDPSMRKAVLTLLMEAAEGGADWRRFLPSGSAQVVHFLLSRGAVLEGPDGLEVKDPVFRDFVSLLYEQEVAGRRPEGIKARRVWEGLKRFEEEKAIGRVQSMRELCRKGLEAFSCQQVPEALFDYGTFVDRFGGRPPAVESGGKTIYLPRIVSTYLEGDLVIGYGFEGGLYREDKGVVWVGICLSEPVVSESGAIGLLERLREVEGVIGERVKGWAIAQKGFSREAEAVLKGRVWMSNMDQLNLLLAILREEEEKGDRSSIFEIALPTFPQFELVAASAVEEIARQTSVDEEAINQIKMALIEACLNASEHGIKGRKDGKIHIKVVLEEGDRRRFVVYVENEGGGIKPYLVSEPSIDEKIGSPHKRGWGFKLMRVLMDEVSFESSMGRTRLKMIKYIE